MLFSFYSLVYMYPPVLSFLVVIHYQFSFVFSLRRTGQTFVIYVGISRLVACIVGCGFRDFLPGRESSYEYTLWSCYLARIGT